MFWKNEIDASPLWEKIENKEIGILEFGRQLVELLNNNSHLFSKDNLDYFLESLEVACETDASNPQHDFEEFDFWLEGFTDFCDNQKILLHTYPKMKAENPFERESLQSDVNIIFGNYREIRHLRTFDGRPKVGDKIELEYFLGDCNIVEVENIVEVDGKGIWVYTKNCL